MEVAGSERMVALVPFVAAGCATAAGGALSTGAIGIGPTGEGVMLLVGGSSARTWAEDRPSIESAIASVIAALSI